MAKPDNQQSNLKGYLLVFAGVALFATVEVAVVDANGYFPGGHFPPMLLTALRFTISGLLFVIIAQFNKNITKKIPHGKDMLYTIGLGIIAAPLAIGLFQKALTYKTLAPSSAASIFSINPIFAAVIAALILKERATLREWVGLVLGFAGAFTMSFSLDKASRTELMIAGSIMIASALFFALNVVISKPMIRKYGGLCYTGWAFLSGGLVALIISLFKEGIPAAALWQVPFKGLADIVWVIIAGTAVAYYCYLVGISKVNVTTGSYFFFTKPFMAIIFALMYIGKSTLFTWIEWLGFGLIMGGLALIIFKRKKTAVPAVAEKGPSTAEASE